MRVVFFGSGAFGLPTLAALAHRHELVGVVTQPDRPAGRGAGLTPTPVARWAQPNAPTVPLFRTPNVNDPQTMASIRAIEARAWVVIAFGQKLSRRLLDGVFAINLHASLLPRWRGAAPINAAILAGDPVTGNSVITLADRMDAGSILGQSRREIDPALTAGELHDLLAADGPSLVMQVLSAHEAGSLTPREQDGSQAMPAPKLSKADGWIDLGQPAEICRRRVHGLTPWPGVTLTFRDQPLKLLRVQPAPVGTQETPGTVVDAREGIIACGSGQALRLLVVQPAGRRAMDWADFARGRDVRAGERLFGREREQ